VTTLSQTPQPAEADEVDCAERFEPNLSVLLINVGRNGDPEPLQKPYRFRNVVMTVRA
jgi:hypothetical protein